MLQFGGTGLWRSTLLLRHNLQTHGRTFSTLFKESCCFSEPKQLDPRQRLWRSCLITYSNKCSFHADRTLFSSEQVKEENSLTAENLIGAWFNEVSTFGSVRVGSVPIDVHIQPLNPMDYPELNKSIVKLYYNNASNKPAVGHKLSEMGKLCNTQVGVEGEKLNVSFDVPAGVKLPLLCVITVPLKFDVDVVQGSDGGSVVIKGLESDNVSVHMQQGDCHLASLKTGSVTVQCDKGNIICHKQLLGSISLRCGGNGSIRGDRFQGRSVDCSTEAGDIDIKTLYADKSTCRSQSGNLHVRDCHGDATTSTESGNLTVDSLDGKLSADLGSGSADVYVTRPDDVHVQTDKGDIILRFSEDGSCSLDLHAKVIDQDGSLPAKLNEEGKGFLRAETEQTVRASAPQGKITLKKQDWLSAIKLQFENTSS